MLTELSKLKFWLVLKVAENRTKLQLKLADVECPAGPPAWGIDIAAQPQCFLTSDLPQHSRQLFMSGLLFFQPHRSQVLCCVTRTTYRARDAYLSGLLFQ